MKLPQPTRPRAFTLIEILISMAILTVVVAAIYSTWMSIIRATQRGEKAAADVQRSRMAVQSVESALTGAAMFSENVMHYSFDVDTSSEFALLSFVSRLPESFPGSGMFPGEPLRRVTFSVEPGDEGNNALVMRQQPMLEEIQAGDEPYGITLAKNINRFELEFWDTNVNDWAYEWLYTNQLPKLVRVLLAFGDENNVVLSSQDVVAKVVSIPSEAVTREYQLASGGGGQGGQGGGPVQMVVGPGGQMIPVPGGGGRGDGRGDGRGGGRGDQPGGRGDRPPGFGGPGGGPRTPGLLPGGQGQGGQRGGPGQGGGFGGQGGGGFGPGGGGGFGGVPRR